MNLRPLVLLALLFSLPLSAATIDGTVRQAANGTALATMTVAVYDGAGVLRAETSSDGSGRYSVTVPAGSYRVLAYDHSGIFATSFFNNAESFETSTVLVLQSNQTVTADFSLVRAGTFSGTVMARDGATLAGVTVAAYNVSGTLRGVTQTDAIGRYQLVVPPGAFRLAAWDDALRYSASFHSDAPTFAAARTVSIGASANMVIDFTLPEAGHIRGLVTDELTKSGIVGAIVTAYDGSGVIAGTAVTTAGGAYDLSLRTGSYRLTFEERSGTWAGAFSGSAAAFEEAAIVVVPEGATLRFDATLPRAARLEGTVRDAAGASLAGITVAAFNTAGSTRTFTTTAPDGRFTLLVPTGDYKIAAYDRALVFATQFGGGEAAFATALTMRAVAPQVISNVDFTLARGGRISGRVTDGGTAAANVTVAAYTASGVLVASAETGADGTYALVVAPGTYTLATFDRALRYTSSVSATPVPVAGGSMQTRDFAMSAAARVTVVTRDITTRAALAGIFVAAYDAAGKEIASALTDANGNAGLALPSGTYRFAASDPRRRYATAYHAAASSFETALPVTVVAGQAETTLNLNLSAGPTSASTGGRRRSATR